MEDPGTDALKAVKLDPWFSYASVLAGHEYAANDDYERALKSFRQALQRSPRMYNAWFGLGTVYFKQERFAAAEAHFRRGVELHPTSSALLCHLGMVWLRGSSPGADSCRHFWS